MEKNLIFSRLMTLFFVFGSIVLIQGMVQSSSNGQPNRSSNPIDTTITQIK
jgi:hypothetical protein